MNCKPTRIIRLFVDTFCDDFTVPVPDDSTLVIVTDRFGNNKVFINGIEIIADLLSEIIKEENKETLPPIYSDSDKEQIDEEFEPIELFGLAPDPYFSYCSEEYKKKYGDDE